MGKFAVRQVYERDAATGQPTRFDTIVESGLYEQATAARRENGMRLAAYHAMPISLETWYTDSEEIPDWHYVNEMTTTVTFVVTEPDNDSD